MQKNKRGESAILDDFYTTRSLAVRLLKVVERITNAPLTAWKQIVEPSAGGGAFFDVLPVESRRGYDINPRCDGVITADFLKVGSNAFSEQPKDTLVVGNPPFGKNGSLAMRFLNLCLTNAEYVAFILPRSFEKESVISRVRPATAHVIHKEILPMDSFERLGVKMRVPTVFMIWRIIPDAPPRKLSVVRSHPDFEFVVFPTEEDCWSGKMVMIQRVGNNAGRITKPAKAMSEKRTSKNFYFVRSLAGPSVLERLERLNLQNGNAKKKTAGMPSIAKTEIVAAYASLFDDPE